MASISDHDLLVLRTARLLGYKHKYYGLTGMNGWEDPRDNYVYGTSYTLSASEAVVALESAIEFDFGIKFK